MSARRLILGIETSNPTAGPRGERDGALLGPGVALAEVDAGGGCAIIGAEALRAESRHDDALMPAIERLCGRCGVRPGDLWRVAVSAGPGGYTGLRIATTAAKMIAEATGCEVTRAPSAHVAAWRLAPELAPAIVCLASKGETAHATLLPTREYIATHGDALAAAMGAEAFAALRAGDGAWIGAALALGLLGAAGVRALRPRTLIADSHLPESMRAAAGKIGADVVEPQFAAESVCRIGARLAPEDPAAVAPIYAREPDAVTQWRKRKG